jgi:apolipoprotein N-acyltransferase
MKQILTILQTKYVGSLGILQAVLFLLLLLPSSQVGLLLRPHEVIYVLAGALFLKVVPLRTWTLAMGYFHIPLLFAFYYAKGVGNLGNLLIIGLGLGLPGIVSFIKWSKLQLQLPMIGRDLSLTLISWVGLALSNPPLKIGYISFVVLVPWLWVLAKTNASRGMFVSYVGAVVYHVVGFYWISNVVKVGPPVVIILGLLLFVSFFSLFYVFMGRVFQKLLHNGIKGMVWLFPLLWVGVEVARTKGDFSFPWCHIGYTLGASTAMMQSLNWLGIFGYSFVIVLVNVWIWYWVQSNHSTTKKVTFAMLGLLVPLYLWGHGQWVLSKAQVSTDTAKVFMLQPSVVQEDKWSKQFYDSTMVTLWTMLDSLEGQQADLIVLPETAVPDFLKRRYSEYKKFKQYAHKLNTTIVVGALNYDKKGPPPRKYRYFNSAFVFDKSGKKVSEYRKINLVPFSERIPFDDVIPLLNYVDLGEGDFSAGDSVMVFDKESLAYSPNICYESIYPALIRRSVHAGARLIVNITNDGWFGKSAAPYHHANLVRFRTIENGIPMARAANSGISVFYDEYGREYHTTQLFERSIISMDIPLAKAGHSTLYSRIGDTVELLLFWSTILLLLFLFLKPKPKAQSPKP